MNVNNNHLAESMQWQLVATLVCCLLLRFEEVGGKDARENRVFAVGVLDRALVAIQFLTVFFMMYRLARSTLWKMRCSESAVVPLIEGGDDTREARAEEEEEAADNVGEEEEEEEEEVGVGIADEAQVLLLKTQVRERDEKLRERESRLKKKDLEIIEKDNGLQERDRIIREREEELRVLKESKNL